MKGSGRVLAAEWYRMARSRVMLGSAVFLALVAALRVLAARMADASVYTAQVQRALSAGRDVPPMPPTGNAWAPFTDGWLAGLTVSTLLLLIASTRAVAGDRESGILRVASTRSASRAGLVLGRALLGVGLTLGALLVTGLGAWIASALLYDFGPVVEDNYELVSSEELRAGLRLSLLATIPPLLTTWFFGLFVSTVTRSGTGAVAVGLATYLGFDLFKEVLGEAQYYVFAAFNPSFVDNSCLHEFADVARGFSDAGYSELRFVQNLWMPWPQALVLVAAACVITRRRPL